MANITRDTFDASKNVLKKVLQKGVHLIDADWNEQVDILNHRQARALALLLNGQSVRFGDGFKAVNTEVSSSATIKAGYGAFQLGDNQAVVLRLASDATVTGFTSFPSGGRTDYIYLDIAQTEINASTDPNLVNPDVGEETCVDVRLSFAFAISVGAPPGAAPSGHYYVVIATVTSNSDSTSFDPRGLVPAIQDYHYTAPLELGAVNLIRNGAFNLWSGGAQYWVAAKLRGVQKEESITRFGPSACFCDYPLPSTGDQGIYQTIPDPQNYRGKPLTAVAWVRTSALTGPFRALIRVRDGVQEARGTVEVEAVDTWYRLSVTLTVATGATEIEVLVGHDESSGGQTMIVDGVGLFVGHQMRDFEYHPDDMRQDLTGLLLPIYNHSIMTAADNTNAQSYEHADQVYTVSTPTGGTATILVLRVLTRHVAHVKKYMLDCLANVANSGCVGKVELIVDSNSATVEFTNTLMQAKHVEIDTSLVAVTAGPNCEIEVMLHVADPAGYDAPAAITRIQIHAEI